MLKTTRKLQREQLSRKLNAFQALRVTTTPARGWIRAIREALGMTAHQLGGRLGLRQTHVTRIEQGEVLGTTTLNTLKRVANALDCDFVFAVVPRTSLKDTLRKQARKVAEGIVDRVSHSMSLEDQETSRKRKRDLVREMTEQLVSNQPKHLWDSE